MKKLLLDCTLRDGGYYTNWDFEDKLIHRYAKSMENLPIDYVEVGYRNIASKTYFGKYFYCPDFILKELKEMMPSKKMAVILNEKDVNKEHVEELLLPIKEYVVLIRIAVDPLNIKRAIGLAKKIKQYGFEVAFNVMYLSNWKYDSSFLNELEGAEEFLDFFYMVDSFGGMTPNDIKETIDLVKTKVNMPLGFHGHNNLELALANSIVAMENDCVIIDATITGMGRGAGNLKTELLLTHLSAQNPKFFDYSFLSNVVAGFEELKDKYKWGTSLPYMFSGANSLPQKQVMEWLSLNRYSMETILNALNIKKDNVVDNIRLRTFSFNKSYKKALIIGGGPSIKLHQEAILRFLQLYPDMAIILSGVRHLDVFKQLDTTKFIAISGKEINELTDSETTFKNTLFVYPPYPRLMGTSINEFIKPLSMELEEMTFSKVSKESPLSVAIELGISLDVQEFYFVGFDGYENRMNHTKHQLSKENQNILDDLKQNTDSKVSFLTPTTYENVVVESLYSFI